ncbi:hypothetical protein C2G38_2175048 [Gigaspora rosea]|uniref:Uncharacterized protein n=1 Tax=Gigaspora rosea TaxID=44941 RepID=A0A397VJ38_9GLOM|nr:hypothetical protein C2G38_2175048 [Gigaspora rosea]
MDKWVKTRKQDKNKKTERESKKTGQEEGKNGTKERLVLHWSAEIGRRECVVRAVVGVRSWKIMLDFVIVMELELKRMNIRLSRYQKSAEMENAGKKNSIGYCYHHGIGVENDEHKASIRR